MRVLMRETVQQSDAGTERYLLAGSEYDVPTALALAWIALGRAERIETRALVGAPENKARRRRA